MRIDGVVVLYNPDEDVLENIEGYRSFLEHLYVIDNSTIADEKIVDQITKFDNVKYISLHGNQGIGKALKVGLQEAINSGVDVCLTMDQDSKFPADKIDQIKDYLNEYINNYAIIGLNFEKGNDFVGIIESQTLITSGNFINMKDYKKIDGFNEDLFIDCVDFELDEQFYNIGRKIGYINEISLIHRMGNPIKAKILGKTITALNHPPIRMYYRFRNGYYLYKKNKKFYYWMKKKLRFAKIKVILYEPDKKEKFKMMRRGIKDAKANKLGKYKEYLTINKSSKN